MTLVLLLHVLLMVVSVASAVFQWATHYRAWGQIQQNERHINSLRSKVSYDRSEIQQMIAEQLASEDQTQGTTGERDPMEMMQMLAMMQGGMGQQQQPAPTPTPEPEPDDEEKEVPEGWEGWLHESSNNETQ